MVVVAIATKEMTGSQVRQALTVSSAAGRAGPGLPDDGGPAAAGGGGRPAGQAEITHPPKTTAAPKRWPTRAHPSCTSSLQVSKLEVFRTKNGRGWGVRAAQPIRKGQFICAYIGELITLR